MPPRRGYVLVLVLVMLALVPTAAGSSADSFPVISYTVDGIAGNNGWYRGSTGGNYVVVRWSVSGADTTDCTFAVTVPGPTTGTTRSCSASNATGPVSATTKTIKIDADAPVGIAAAPARPPDANGWYNHPVAVAWHGSDPTSGIAACTVAAYSGPDAGAATVPGGCSDNAGNFAAAPFGLKYDATAPTIHVVQVASDAGADIVQWKAAGADSATVLRAARGSTARRIVFRGGGARFVDKSIRAGVEYHYTVQAYDQAGNASKAVSALALPKVVTLGGPAYVTRAAGAPILRWGRVRGATYYHVQLFRRGRRILAAWPRAPQLSLRRSWIWSGKRYRLAAGRYRWFAWAGFGGRAAARYKLLGKDDFIVG